MEKVSYALGLSVGANLLSSGIKDLNVSEFVSALTAMVEGGETKMTNEEAQAVLGQYFQELSNSINEKNIEVGKEFLAKNKEQEGVVELPSGLQYKVITEGNGKKPGANDKVECHYEGMLLDGTVFDSSVKRGQTSTFGVTQVIAGWIEALQLMSEGSKWQLFIPSDLAYGAQGAGQSIPPHATLIFEVELIKIV